MSTLADMTDELANELIGGQSNDEIRASISEAISCYENERFWFLETSSVFNTVIGQDYYTDTEITDPPLTRLIELDRATVLINGYECEIDWEGSNRVDWKADSQSTGEPYALALYGERLRLYPIPDQVYQVTLKGAFRQEELDLEDDDATSAWFDKRYGYYLVKAKTAALVEAIYNRNQDSAERYEALADQHYRKAKAGGSRRRFTGTIQGSL